MASSTSLSGLLGISGGVEERIDTLSSPHKTSVLSCPACQVPCPLGFGAQAQCVRCQTVIPLTAAQQERRESQRRLDAERRQSDDLWQIAVRSRAHFFHKPVFLASLSYVAPFIAAIGGYFFGYRDNEYGRAGLVWLLGIGVIHFVTSSLLLRRKPQLLRALLSAQSSGEPGIPPLCRVCAAPLSIPDSPSQEVSCDHCGADNILGRSFKVAPRPDLYGTAAAYREVFGDKVSQRAARLYPVTLLLGFAVLGVLSYFAIHAPTQPSPWQ